MAKRRRIALGAGLAPLWLTAFGGLSIVVGDILAGHGVHARQRKAQERGRKAKRS